LFLDWRYLATFWSSAPAKWKIDRNWDTTLGEGGLGPQILTGLPQIVDPVSKITPVYTMSQN